MGMTNQIMNPMNNMSMNNPMNGMGMPPFIPNFGLGPNDSMNMFNSMLNIFNNNSFYRGSPSTTGYFPGPRNSAPSPFIFNDRSFGGNRMDNNMNMMMNNNMMNNNMNMNMNMMMMMNMNLLMNNMTNNMMRLNFDDDDNEMNDIKRNESLDVKMDIDNILKNKNELEKKNKNRQYILNYIPFTIIKDAPKANEDDPHCLICLSDFQVDEKVSALPCCHCFHTNCLDKWIVRNAKCPICKFEITLKNLIGEDTIKEHLKRIEEAKKESERKEKERKEKERIEKERKEKERKEKERKEREQKEKERRERERLERERREKERKEREQKEKERRERERLERERREKERKEKESSNKPKINHVNLNIRKNTSKNKIQKKKK